MIGALHTVKPREKAGAKTAARYEFQANVSILKILDIHKAGDDYRAIFDHFDDLTILNSSSNPTRIKFIQIKGREGVGTWTIKQLVKEELAKAKPRSVIGKMYKNAADFPTETDSISFVTNGIFKFKLKDGTTTNSDNTVIKAPDLDDSELSAIDAVLEPDFPNPRTPAVEGILFFERTNLPMQEQAVFVTGRLVQYLETYGAGESFSVQALYNVLYQNIAARTRSTEESNSADEFNARKSLSRDEIESLISRARSKKQFQDSWPAISVEMTAAGYTSVEVIRAHTAAISYIMGRARGDRSACEFNLKATTITEKDKQHLCSCGTILKAASDLQLRLSAGEEYLGALLVEAYEVISDEKK